MELNAKGQIDFEMPIAYALSSNPIPVPMRFKAANKNAPEAVINPIAKRRVVATSTELMAIE